MKSTVAKYVDQAFKACVSIAEDATYRVFTSHSRDPNTYELIQNSGEVPIKCILTNYSQKELDFHPDLSTLDKKILIPSKYFSGETYLSGEMTVGAQIETSTIIFDVIEIEKDPTGSLFTVHGRESTT
jgi:hypothetical protein